MDVLGIGNALVDILCETTDAHLSELGLNKGTMHLVDQHRAVELYKGIRAAREISGGSAANTIAGVASFGGRAGYIGKVAHDKLGDTFRHDIQAQGITFNTAPHSGELSTGNCLVLVTPDGERTMNTYLGASNALTVADLDKPLIRSAQVTYLEGYLFDPPAAKEAFRVAAEVALAAGRYVALTLSDMFCVSRHQADFAELIKTHVNILFANEHELCAQYETSELETAIAAAREQVEILAVTRGAAGAMIITKHDVVSVPAEPVAKVVDTTGAGDLFAGGFLYGFTRDKSHAESARYGAIAAAEVISHIGARPKTPLAARLA
jgi:sugar/nucleoside kinase (ribokinase family)